MTVSPNAVGGNDDEKRRLCPRVERRKWMRAFHRRRKSFGGGEMIRERDPYFIK